MSTRQAAVPRLYGDAHAERPQDTYAQLRAAGPVAWAEIADGIYALVVTDWSAARELLTDPGYSTDPGHWDAFALGTVPYSLAFMAIPGLQHTDGAVHERLRRAMDDCLASIDLHGVRRAVHAHARSLITEFAGRGHADLLSEYADRVTARTLAELVGFPAEAADRIRSAADLLVTGTPDAAKAWTDLTGLVQGVIAEKKKHPGGDLTSWMLAHPAELSDDEVVQQLVSVLVLGAGPTAAWIGGTLHTLLTEPSYASQLVGGSVTIRAALTETLSVRCPAAHMSARYASRPKLLHGVQVTAGVPVLVSHAATGQDPARPGTGDARDRSHLAWSAGPHFCPAQGLATTIAESAIETVIDALWDLATPTPTVANRPGPFQQCPAHVGVLFTTAPAPSPCD